MEVIKKWLTDRRKAQKCHQSELVHEGADLKKTPSQFCLFSAAANMSCCYLHVYRCFFWYLFFPQHAYPQLLNVSNLWPVGHFWPVNQLRLAHLWVQSISIYTI